MLINVQKGAWSQVLEIILTLIIMRYLRRRTAIMEHCYSLDKLHYLTPLIVRKARYFEYFFQFSRNHPSIDIGWIFNKDH